MANFEPSRSTTTRPCGSAMVPSPITACEARSPTRLRNSAGGSCSGPPSAVRACSAASFSARRVRSASACAFQSLSTWRLGAGPSDGGWRVGSVMVVLSGSREV